jgi:hypothetical protein
MVLRGQVLSLLALLVQGANADTEELVPGPL